jgi:hypothetical protein
MTYPSWRLGQWHNRKEREQCEYALKGKGKPELRLIVHIRHSIIDPVGRHYTKDVDCQLNAQL